MWFQAGQRCLSQSFWFWYQYLEASRYALLHYLIYISGTWTWILLYFTGPIPAIRWHNSSCTILADLPHICILRNGWVCSRSFGYQEGQLLQELQRWPIPSSKWTAWPSKVQETGEAVANEESQGRNSNPEKGWLLLSCRQNGFRYFFNCILSLQYCIHCYLCLNIAVRGFGLKYKLRVIALCSFNEMHFLMFVLTGRWGIFRKKWLLSFCL